MSEHLVLQGDCLKLLPTLPPATCLFADPPDNLGLKYADTTDKMPSLNYYQWLCDITVKALKKEPKVFWLSHFHRHTFHYMAMLQAWAAQPEFANVLGGWEVRQFVWRFTFGQHRDTDCGNGYRPILRFSRPGTKWSTDDIRIPSARQEKYGDKRANPKGRVPDDVWDFSRVCGTFHERRPWHPTQHPEALMERIVRMSCAPGSTVLDLFGGTFTTDRVCRRLGIDCTSLEVSPTYCQRYLAEVATAGLPAVRVFGQAELPPNCLSMFQISA